jgi:uncharacterized protein
MRIFIKAKPNVHEEKVEKIDSAHFLVCVKEPPQNGLANKGIERALADYFGISRSRVKIINGFASKQKIAEIL